jgi:uncharacterized protein (DUF1778 family)
MKTQPQIRDLRIGARVTEKEFKAIAKAAKQSKTTVAEYIRLAILG